MINTLDLDEIDKEELNRILTKIKLNSCCDNVTFKCSTSKGFHVFIFCKKQCDLCRFVFDDDKRFAIDSVMPLKFRDFLFTEKVPFNKMKITPENLNRIGELTI